MLQALARTFQSTSRPETLAVVDLGSNSFRLEVGRVEGDQIFRLDTWRETIRFGAGMDAKGNLTLAARKAALACLARFRERLSGLHPSAVRAVATNTFRVARNASTFLPQAEAALGFPIDIIGGHEEARLIYLGVAHVLPASNEPRLVIDIGGGSTEFIIGRGMTPERLESLKLGCVSISQRFFANGELRAEAFRAAETDARAHIDAGSSTINSIRTEHPPSVSGLKFLCSVDSSATQKSAPPTPNCPTPPPGTENNSSAPNAAL